MSEVQMESSNLHLHNVKKMSEIDISKLADNQVILATENLSPGVVITKSIANVNSSYLNGLINSYFFNNKKPIILKSLGNDPNEAPETDDHYAEILDLIVEYMMWRSQWIPKHPECIGNQKLEFEMHREWLLNFLNDVKSTDFFDVYAVVNELKMNNLGNHLFMKISNDLKHLEKDIVVGQAIPEHVLAETNKYFNLDRYPKREIVPKEKEEIVSKGKEAKEEKTTYTCSICWEDEDNLNEMHILPCKHHLHKDCFAKLQHYSTKCPMCRRNYTEHLIN